MTELAAALGKSEASIRRWVEADKIPAPYLRETSRGHRVYSVGEAEVILRNLPSPETGYSYLTSTADTRMHEQMHNYRSQHI